MKYKKPEIEIVQLEVADIITSSPFGEDDNVTQEGEGGITTPPTWG